MLPGCDSLPGIAALTFALLMSARMGIFQETLYKQFGKHSKEALFYNVSHCIFSVSFTGQRELLRDPFPPIQHSDSYRQPCELLQRIVVSVMCSPQTPKVSFGGAAHVVNFKKRGSCLNFPAQQRTGDFSTTVLCMVEFTACIPGLW